MIQRQLEEVEEKQRSLEERGVTLEKLLRGETSEEQGVRITGIPPGQLSLDEGGELESLHPFILKHKN